MKAGSRVSRVELGLNLGYWGMGNNADNLALAREADRLGYSVVWAVEAYGSDSAGRVRKCPKAGTVCGSPSRWLAPASTSRSSRWHWPESGSATRARRT